MSKKIDALTQVFYSSPELLATPFINSEFTQDEARRELLVGAIAEAIIKIYNADTQGPDLAEDTDSTARGASINLPNFIIGTSGLANSVVDDVAGRLGGDVQPLKSLGSSTSPRLDYESRCALRKGEDNQNNRLLILDDVATTGKRIYRLSNKLEAIRLKRKPEVTGLVVFKRKSRLRSLNLSDVKCHSVLSGHYE